MKLNCPVCSASLDLDDSLAKKLTRCPKCDQSFVVPAIAPRLATANAAVPVAPPPDEFELSPSLNDGDPSDAPVDPDTLKFCPGCGRPWKPGMRECKSCHFVPALGAQLKPKTKPRNDLRVNIQKVYLVIFLAGLGYGIYCLFANWDGIRKWINSIW